AEVAPGVRTAVQAEQNGTGHAVRMGLEELGGAVDGTVIVVCGDTPLLTGATLRELAATHAAEGKAVTVLTAGVPDAAGCGVGGAGEGTVMGVCGDAPRRAGATWRELAATHAAEGNAVTVLTAEVPDATGYGRIVRDEASGAVTAIVEHKDASEEQRAVREIN